LVAGKKKRKAHTIEEACSEKEDNKKCGSEIKKRDTANQLASTQKSSLAIVHTYRRDD
jgi:hypothetical protein